MSLSISWFCNHCAIHCSLLLLRPIASCHHLPFTCPSLTRSCQGTLSSWTNSPGSPQDTWRGWGARLTALDITGSLVHFEAVHGGGAGDPTLSLVPGWVLTVHAQNERGRVDKHRPVHDEGTEPSDCSMSLANGFSWSCNHNYAAGMW